MPYIYSQEKWQTTKKYIHFLINAIKKAFPTLAVFTSMCPMKALPQIWGKKTKEPRGAYFKVGYKIKVDVNAMKKGKKVDMKPDAFSKFWWL